MSRQVDVFRATVAQNVLVGSYCSLPAICESFAAPEQAAHRQSSVLQWAVDELKCP